VGYFPFRILEIFVVVFTSQISEQKPLKCIIFWRKFVAKTADLAEVLVEEAVEKRIGTGAAHPTDVTGRVHNHSRLLLQPIRMFRESGPTNRNGGKPYIMF
jgi:hypothetical protein